MNETKDQLILPIMFIYYKHTIVGERLCSINVWYIKFETCDKSCIIHVNLIIFVRIYI